MHTGRIGHPLNLPEGAEIIAPSSVKIGGQMWTDQEGMQDHPIAREMTLEDIENTIEEYVTAARNSIEVGADGEELHGANGYLIEQFIAEMSNLRTDEYGGSPEKRARFAIEVTKRVSDAIGKERVGIRISPYGVYNDIGLYDSLDETYEYLVNELNKLNIAYIHLVDHSSQGAPEVPQKIKNMIRTNFKNTFILSGGYDKERAENDLKHNNGDLIAFGRPILANPDLLYRLENNIELNQPKYDLLFAAGVEGYTDYPVAS